MTGRCLGFLENIIMIKNIIKALFLVFLMLLLSGCEEIIGAITGGLVIQEPDDNDLILSDWVEVVVKCYEGEINHVKCGGHTEVVIYSEGSGYVCPKIDLTEGSNTIYARGYDIDNYEVDSDSVTVRCDTLAPGLTVNSPANTAPPVVISGTVSDENGIRSLTYKGDNGLYGYINLSGGNSWSLSLYTLKDQTEYEFEFVAEDAAGRQTTRTLNFPYDNPDVP